MSPDDLMKSIVIMMQGGVGDTMRLYQILLTLRKNESLSPSDMEYLLNLIQKHLKN
jgi:hypothetical protein